MKNSKFNFTNYLFNFMVVLFVAAAVIGAQLSFATVATSAAVAFVTGTGLSYLGVYEQNLTCMAIQKEIWQNHIEEELFKDNSFLRYSFSADEYLINSKAVHIPQSGGSGNVVVNRNVFPANIRTRADQDVIYLIDEYTSDPVKIPHADTKELSYDKRASVLGEDIDNLVEETAEYTLLNWVSSPAYGTYAASVLPSTSILETTGDNVAASAEGATGLRKGAALNDLQRVRNFLKGQKRWKKDKMYGMITAAQEAELFPANDLVTATYMNAVTEEERREGVMYKCQGFKLMTRTSIYRTQADKTLLAYGAAGSSTDCEASFFWYQNAVEFAFGGVEMFETIGDPTQYGDIYSFLARAGGRARRQDYKGICLLKQAASA